MPLWPRTSPALISGITSGTESSMRKALELSTTTLPARAAMGANSFEMPPPALNRAKSVVVDNSSAFRMDDSVPLVIPEINAGDVRGHKGIIANPNCTTAVTLMALFPLHQAFQVKRIFASSYQAVSGTGAKAIEELRRQVAQIVN